MKKKFIDEEINIEFIFIIYYIIVEKIRKKIIY